METPIAASQVGSAKSNCAPPTIDHRLTTANRRPPPLSKGYNIRVNNRVPQNPPPDREPHDKHQHHHAIYAAEASGLLLMAVLLLVLILIRYWRYIPWNAR